MDSPVSFLGYSISPEVKKIVPILQNINSERLVPVLDLVFSFIGGSEPSVEEFEVVARQSNLEKSQAAFLFAGLFELIKRALREKIKQLAFKAALEELKITPPIVNFLWNQFSSRFLLPSFLISLPSSLFLIQLCFSNDQSQMCFQSRGQLEQKVTANRMTFPRLEKLDWRIDITISSSKQSMVLRPAVFLQMDLSDGNKQEFELNILRFHQLRYFVSKMLKDMEDLEQLAILKIDD